MGKGGDNLSFISTKTGAKLIRKDGEVYIVSGTDEQKEQARLHIKVTIVRILNSLISYYYILDSIGNRRIHYV